MSILYDSSATVFDQCIEHAADLQIFLQLIGERGIDLRVVYVEIDARALSEVGKARLIENTLTDGSHTYTIQLSVQ